MAIQYTMPAEWAPHASTWIGWPVNEADWPGKLASVEWAFVEIVRHLARVEGVNILARDASVREEARKKLERAEVNLDAVSFHLRETDRNWLRDSGAIFVREGSAGNWKALHFNFNAWAKYDNYQLDQHVPETMAAAAGVERERPAIEGDPGSRWMVLEGGAIDVNGSGLLLATEECLLGPIQERNPGYGRRETEEALRRYLGAAGIIWLKNGIVGDDTGGHVDDVARFVSERTVITMEDRHEKGGNAELLKENLEILRSYKDEKGRLEVVSLPMPEPLIFEGLQLPASYANFYIANETVLVPTFNDPADRQALGILQELMPDRKVRGIHSVDLIWGFGSVHCLTQQQPAM